MEHSDAIRELMRGKPSSGPPRQSLAYDLATKVLYEGMSYQDAALVLLRNSKKGTTPDDALYEVQSAARDMVSPAEWQSMHPAYSERLHGRWQPPGKHTP